jgi:xanthine/CO dehydrogenase XdhC/CoxF family maturation factor
MKFGNGCRAISVDAPPIRIFSIIHAPAGLDIGADDPEQIALSILAEIQASLSGRNGGELRRRKLPIHADAASRMEESCGVLA